MTCEPQRERPTENPTEGGREGGKSPGQDSPELGFARWPVALRSPSVVRLSATAHEPQGPALRAPAAMELGKGLGRTMRRLTGFLSRLPKLVRRSGRLELSLLWNTSGESLSGGLLLC